MAPKNVTSAALAAGVLLVELDAEDEGVEAQEDDERHGHPLEDHPTLVAVHLADSEGGGF